MRPIEDLSNTCPAAGAVPSSYDELVFLFDERHGQVPPDTNDLFAKRRDAFNLAKLGPVGTAPSLYGRIKSLKSPDFDGVSSRQTFTSNMTDETRKALNLFTGREKQGEQEG